LVLSQGFALGPSTPNYTPGNIFFAAGSDGQLGKDRLLGQASEHFIFRYLNKNISDFTKTCLILLTMSIHRE